MQCASESEMIGDGRGHVDEADKAYHDSVAKSSELLVGPPYEEVGPQMGWSFPHHQSRLPCCHQADSPHKRNMSTPLSPSPASAPISLMKLSNDHNLPNLALSWLKARTSIK